MQKGALLYTENTILLGAPPTAGYALHIDEQQKVRGVRHITFALFMSCDRSELAHKRLLMIKIGSPWAGGQPRVRRASAPAGASV
jgi:hypothetical protein